MNEIVFMCAIALCVVFLIRAKFGDKPEKVLGFSLVEMLMALLVASLLLAALAPVMTRRMNENLHIVGTGGLFSRSYTCVYREAADNSEQDKCHIPSGVYSVSILAASGGGGGGGASERTTGSKTQLLDVNGGTGAYGTQTANQITFNGTTKELEIELGGGGGGGGGTAYFSGNAAPQEQADCQGRDANGFPNGTNFGAFVASGDNGNQGNICVSLYNPASNGNGTSTPTIPGGVTKCTAGATSGQSGYCGSNTNCTTGANCCWEGTTAGAYDSNMPVNGQNYSGRNRAVCQWNAANTICSQWRPLGQGTGMPVGRLPKQEELAGWANKVKMIDASTTGVLNHYGSKYTGSSTANTKANATGGSYPGLQLCDYNASSTYGAAQCQWFIGGCQGAAVGTGNATHCYPYGLWSSSEGSGAGSYTNRELVGGAYANTYTRSVAGAFGVRCVLGSVPLFNSFSGGGGSAGAYVKVKVPEEVIREAVKRSPNGTGIIKYGVGAGGTRGTSASLEGARNGENGTYSHVSITASDGTELWYVQVPGGKGGTKGTATNTASGTVGNAGAQVTTETGTNCQYRNALLEDGSNLANAGYKTARKAIACNAIPDASPVTAGSAGAKPTGKNVNALGGTNTTLGANLGAGGSGVRCYRNSLTSTAVSCPNTETTGGHTYNGDGKGGKVRIYRTLSYPGAGGGGGSAGMIARFDNFNVSDGDSIKAVVGKGGTGGQKGRSGANGGDTIIKIVHPTSDTTETTKAVITIPGGVGGAVGGSANIASSTVAAGGRGGNPTRTITITQSKIDNLKLTASFPVNSSTSDDGIKTLKATDGKALTLGEFYKKDYVAGGNGGVNTKVPPADINSAPCGGYSDVDISYKKDNNTVKIQCAVYEDNDPTKPLTNAAPVLLPYNRAIQDFNIGFIDAPPVAATGGGGAAWIDADNLPSAQTTGSTGIGGYVYIYFIDQSNNNEGGGESGN